MSLLGGIGAHLSKRLTNAVTGVTFNQDAFEVAHAQPLKLSEISEDGTPEYLTEEEWSNLTKNGHRAHDQVDLRNEFEVMESPAVAIKHLGIKITQVAVERAAEAADVGQEYAKFALKFIASEARRPSSLSSVEPGSTRPPVRSEVDIGWITNSKTMNDVISTVKQRFPLLKDIEAAYKNSRQASKEERRARMPSYKLRNTGAASKSSLQPPMNDQSPFTDPPHRKVKRADSTNRHDGFADVSLNDSSDDDYDADIEIDEQEDELYAKNSAERYFNKSIDGGSSEDNSVDADNEDEQFWEAERVLDAERAVEAARAKAANSKDEQKRLYQMKVIKESDQESKLGQRDSDEREDNEPKGYFSTYAAQRKK